MAEDEIRISEEDEEKAAAGPEKKAKPSPGGRFSHYKQWYLDRKKWTIPATVLVLALILAGVPFTRYNLAGLVHKRNLEIQVIDATANTPVSGATVSLGSVSGETSAYGTVVLNNVKVGHQKVTVSKKYYQSAAQTVLSPIFQQKTVPVIKLKATGRQVKISVTNLISKKALYGVDIKVADITAKTDQTGSAIVVLPAGVSQEQATLSLDGYNDAQVTVKVSNDKIQENDFNMTPAGKVYFLSKLSGKIDVVKTNLDGTDRQTVLAGTGNEDDNNTVLLASRDWKYLALLSRRAGNTASLYLIDTSNDSLTTIDEGNASFSITGWVDHYFVYTVTRNDIQDWQANQQSLKDFNADTKKITVLDQTQGSGTNAYDYMEQSIGGVYGYSGQVYYIMDWSGGYDQQTALASKQATFNSVKTDGSAKKAIKSFAVASGTQTTYISVNEVVESPDKVGLEFSDGASENFYIYQDGQVKSDSSQNDQSFFSQNSPTYLLSPDGNNTFWSEPRDGKNTLFIGDEDGANGKQIATLSEYDTYGWYTDNYLLVSKDASELYIMDSAGKQTPVKISDYHKPAQSFNGYGGGYGGL